MGISLNEIIDKLNVILAEEPSQNRESLVMKFNDLIFLSDDLDLSEEVEESLIDLAEILEYYAADPKSRKEHKWYYGDEQLEINIKEALGTIENLRTKVE